MNSFAKGLQSKLINKLSSNNAICQNGSQHCLLMIMTNYGVGIEALDFSMIHSYLTKKNIAVQIATKLGGAIIIANFDPTSEDRYQQYIQNNPLNTSSIAFDSVDPSMFDGVIITSSENCLMELVSCDRLGYILQEFQALNKVICAVGFGVAGLLSAMSGPIKGDTSMENGVTHPSKKWAFMERSLTGPTIQQTYKHFNSKDSTTYNDHPIFLENQIRFEGGNFVSSDDPSKPHHIVIDNNLVTAQSTVSYGLLLKIVVNLIRSTTL